MIAGLFFPDELRHVVSRFPQSSGVSGFPRRLRFQGFLRQSKRERRLQGLVTHNGRCNIKVASASMLRFQGFLSCEQDAGFSWFPHAQSIMQSDVVAYRVGLRGVF